MRKTSLGARDDAIDAVGDHREPVDLVGADLPRAELEVVVSRSMRGMRSRSGWLKRTSSSV
jgi:hypothetical protein